MKLLALLGLTVFAVSAQQNAECPHDLEVKCIDDINKSYAACEAAAKEKGKDIPVDLQCMKYFAQVSKDCWPCICYFAQTAGVHIRGCN